MNQLVNRSKTKTTVGDQMHTVSKINKHSCDQGLQLAW